MQETFTQYLVSFSYPSRPMIIFLKLRIAGTEAAAVDGVLEEFATILLENG